MSKYFYSKAYCCVSCHQPNLLAIYQWLHMMKIKKKIIRN